MEAKTCMVFLRKPIWGGDGAGGVCYYWPYRETLWNKKRSMGMCSRFSWKKNTGVAVWI